MSLKDTLSLFYYYVFFVNMFLRPFGSKRLRESYVFKNYFVFKILCLFLHKIAHLCIFLCNFC